MALDIPRTRRKLEETKFFLRHLEERTRQPTQHEAHEVDVFGYYLSAFLSAGRSVTFVLQVEDKAAYDKGSPAWQQALSAKDQELFKYMNLQRREEIHSEGAWIEAGTATISITSIGSLGGRSYSTTTQVIFMGAEDGPFPTVAVLAPRFRVSDAETLEAVPACRRYVELLESLVKAIVS
jgi:hypothetical protein